MTHKYPTLDQIKYRMKIKSADTQFDTELESAREEGSRHLDELIRPYLSYGQTLTLTGSYTSCDGNDIGREVYDDEVVVGTLRDYNNKTQKWNVKTISTVADASAVYVRLGTGKGTTTGSSTSSVTTGSIPYLMFSELPLTGSMVTNQITEIAADFGAAIFSTRSLPHKENKEWWDLADRKINTLINSNWKQAKIIFC